MVRRRLELAAITTEDPHAGLPEPAELGQRERRTCGSTLDDVDALGDRRQDRTGAGAEPPRSTSIRASSTPKAPPSTRTSGARVFANSRGFAGRLPHQQLLAQRRARGARRRLHGARLLVHRRAQRGALEEPGGRRPHRRRARAAPPGARKVPTQKAPVVFEPRAARALLDHIFEAVNGDAVYRNASFLAGKLGEKIAAELRDRESTTRRCRACSARRRSTTRACPSRRTVVIEKGVLTSYLLNTYTARQARS